MFSSTLWLHSMEGEGYIKGKKTEGGQEEGEKKGKTKGRNEEESEEGKKESKGFNVHSFIHSFTHSMARFCPAHSMVWQGSPRLGSGCLGCSLIFTMHILGGLV